MRLVPPVEHVVLEHEEDVEKDGEEAKTELGGVAKDAAPVVIVVGDQHHLENKKAVKTESLEAVTDLDDTERSTGEVQDDVPDAPTDGALPSVVLVGLGDVPDGQED